MKYLKSTEIDEDNDPESLNLKVVPKHTMVFEVSGPMFFGAADKLVQLTNQLSQDVQVVILRMRSVPAIDATAMNSLNEIYQKLKNQEITMIFSHVMEQPLMVMKKAGFISKIDTNNICVNIDAALLRAEELIIEKNTYLPYSTYESA